MSGLETRVPTKSTSRDSGEPEIVKIIKLILNISGRVQAARRDRAQLLPRPGEALQAAHLQAQGAEAEGGVITFIASTYYS